MRFDKLDDYFQDLSNQISDILDYDAADSTRTQELNQGIPARSPDSTGIGLRRYSACPDMDSARTTGI